MTIDEIFKNIKTELKISGILNPEIEATWIIEKYLKLKFLDIICRPDRVIEENKVLLMRQAVQRRKEGEPLAYILEEKEFMGLRFLVNRDVLIPRPETEHLVEWAFEWQRDNLVQSEEVEVLDLGTGSGCIGLSVLKLEPKATATLIDISGAALDIARKNATELGVHPRAKFIQMDFSKEAKNWDEKKFDVILANPPYVDPDDSDIDWAVKKYEPKVALYSQPGLKTAQEWLNKILPLLKDKAIVGFEIGHRQGDEALEMFNRLGVFSKQYIIRDLANQNRIVCGER